MRGIIEREIDGKVRQFHFGTYWSMLCEEEGIDMTNPESLKDAPVRKLIHASYNAAVAYCKVNRMECDFEMVDVAYWMDQTGGPVKFMESVVEALQNVNSKNGTALETQGTA
jgi:hypothetical protein